MAGFPSGYTTKSIPTGQTLFNGGLNSTAGPLSLKGNESPDLQNTDFNKFGSVLQRGGYTALNTSAVTNTPQGDGLHWFEYTSGSTTTRFAVSVADGKLWKMDALDGTWDNITGSLTITSTNHTDFVNFLNEVYMTNGKDAPFKWTGSGNGTAMTVPTGLTTASFVREFNNYLFLANVTVSGTTHKSRIYWSDLVDTATWTATHFIDIAKNDGQAITGVKVLGDRLVVFKERSIYLVFFTGDADIPFILPGGGKTNSTVGCIAPFSIQEVDNGLVFYSHDGLYFFDGYNSFKLSDKITTTLDGMNQTKLQNGVSLNYKKKNVYMLSLASSAVNNADTVIVWNYFLNAFSVYKGIAASALAIFMVNGTDERPYFYDYSGFCYRMDIGTNDYPLNVETAIDSYYWTNWKTFGDLVSKKEVPQAVLYHTISNSTLSFSWAYDFDDTEAFTTTFSMASSADVYGTGVYGTATYAKSGGAIKRRDLTSRGRVVRFKFANNTIDETWQIDGFGMFPHGETNV